MPLKSRQTIQSKQMLMLSDKKKKKVRQKIMLRIMELPQLIMEG